MAPISVKIVMDNGAVTRTIKIDSSQSVSDVIPIVEEKMLNGASGKDYGLFLNSADDEKSGIWLEGHRNVDYYMLRDGDSLQYLPRTRTMRIRMLDGSVKTMQMDESKPVEDLMLFICSKIGITNHEEYGLCREEQVTEAEEQKPNTGTLTLKRKAHKEERDAYMEQLSKKLKTDDNVEWLDLHRTLREMAVDQKETLLLKRRLFYSDRRIDARDPVQLNLLYVQTRDAILEGRHPVTVDQAVEFAGIQCQIHYGDFQEEKHKPGFIENLREFLPEEYATSWGVEKKILKAYKKHVGISQLDAKYMYTRTARELPTYGVTFFLVKEQQKNKKKLVPRLLGINASSILRLDEVTKDILQVWPLTQVKTFHAGKTNSFTLNFGDYSDKEYSVKTNDAHRIRDILQGYIDLIRKRMAGPFNPTQVEGGIIYQDSVESSRANIMEIVSNQPGKLIEESFVGPSRIISVEQGTSVSQGTQITTVQQIIISDKLKSQQQGVSGEVPMRSDFVRKLNRMNSSSVKIVTLLSDSDENYAKRAEVQDIVNTMKENMPDIENGVRQAASKLDEQARKKLLDELQELSDSMCAMVNSVDTESFNPVEAEDSAKKIANLTTEMYCSLDPRTKRRSELFSTHSRQSFIEDEKTRDSINQAGFITAASNVLRAVDSANESLSDENYGVAVSEGADIDKSAAKRLDKLNAAVSMYLTAYEDPNHIDYPKMTQSMQTVQLELPALAKDLNTLSIGDDKHGKELLDKSRALCDALRKLCVYTNAGDRDNIQDAAKNYGDKSRHLLSYIYSPGGCRNPDKENEIMELAKEAANKTSVLLAKTNELTSLTPNDPEAHEVDKAGAACADSARNLLTCAQLTAPSIHEPHCQSALTAASENVSSSAQHLAAMWKPLLKDPSRHQIAEDLRSRAMDLAKALDRLKEAYTVPDDEGSALKKRQRMQFLMTKKMAQNNLQNAQKELDKPIEALKPGSTADALERSLAKRLGELNAAIASLIAATSDKENPDYDKAETAISTISKLMPEVIKGTKTLSATKEDKERQAMLDSIRSLCDATSALCAGIESEDQDEGSRDAAIKFAKSSGRLLYTFTPNLSQHKEHEIIDLSKATCEAASELLAHAYNVAESVGGEEGARVDARGARVADKAQTLLTTAQITAPSMHELNSRTALLSAADELAQSAHHLAAEWAPLVQRPELQPLGKELDHALRSLEKRIENLKKECEANDDIEKAKLSPEKQRIKFIATKSAAHNAVQNAEKELDKPVVGTKATGPTADEIQRALAEKLAQLNAAIASLISATSDRENLDYEAAEKAANTISQLMPTIVKDTKTLTAGKSEKERQIILDEIKALCDATRGLCASDEQLSNGDLNDAAVKFANSSGRLFYKFSPHSNQQKEHQIVELSKETCEAASELLARAYRLAESVEGEGGARVDAQGARVADKAQTLITTAQITAPSVHEQHSRTALLSAADGLSESVHQLAAEWKPLVHRPELRPLGEELDHARQNVDRKLENLKKACDISHHGVTAPLSPNQERRRIKFTAQKSAAQNAMQIAEKELNKTITDTKVSGQEAEELQRSLAKKLAQLNAAIASLISATSDRRNPNYEAAENALNTISQLIPAVVKDAKTLSAGKSDKERQAMLDDIRALCDATKSICASDGQLGDGDLNDAANRFANSSGRLFYTFSPHLNQQKEHQIIDLSKATCEAASELLARAYRIAETVGGEEGARVDARGATVADNAQALLTTSQITAPSLHEPHCRTAMLSAAEGLKKSAHHLAEEWTPLVQKPELQLLGKELDHAKQVLEQRVEELKKACEAAGDTNEPTLTHDQEKRRITFIATKSAAHDAVRNAEKELEKPVIGIKTSGPSHEDLRRSLANKLAELNAAIASLITATSDHDNVDYEAAENALNSLSQLLPTVVKDAKTLSAGKSDKERQAMLDDIRALCDATRGICASDGQLGEEDLKSYAAKYANVSARLFYTISPLLDQQKEHQIIDVSKATCEAASELLARAYCVAESVGGEQGARVDARGARVADNAQALLVTAQITAPSMHEPHCRTALLSAADELAQSAHHLAAEWTPLVQRPELQPLGKELDHAQQNLEKHIEKLKTSCIDTTNAKTKPAVPVRKGSLKGKKSGDTLSESVKHKDLTKEFLHQLRDEASHDIVASSEDSAKREQERKVREDQRKVHEKFVRDMDEAAESIEKIEKSLKKKYNSSKSKEDTKSPAELLEAQKRMERNLALASVAVSSLVASNHPKQIDYTGASKSTSTISELLPLIVEDGIRISGSLEDKSRKPFLDNVLSLCKSSQKLCHSAKDNPGCINDNAVEFGNTSAKLLYAVSTEFDPSQEKAVIERAKLIGDNASRVSLSGVTAAKLVGEDDDKLSNIICEAGGRCADAAGSLVYTAKLVAPSIQHPECQETLAKASENLSTRLNEFSETWTSLNPDPKYAKCIQDLESESSDLAALLQKLKQELKEGVLVKKREPKLLIEDTPFRQLATKILEDAKKRAESTDLPETERRHFAKYSNELADAVHLMDIANAKCRQSPHDLKKREELEDSVQNIQHILLQLRSRSGDAPQSNIVDLTDYVKEVSSAAESLIETANKTVSTAGKNTEVEDINNECHKITLNAFRLLSPSQSNLEGTTEDDILQVDQFGQDCELRVQNIKALLDNKNNKKLQDALREDETLLTERCNLLRFATKSALATAKSAALEETINDLNDLEAKIDKMLLSGQKGNHKVRKYNSESAPVLLSRAEVSAAVGRAGSGEPQNLVPSLNKYIAQLRTTDAADPHNKKLLSEHLSRLVQTLKCYAVTTSRRVATWQRIDEDQISSVTQKISQEFDDADNLFGKSGTKSDLKALKAVDVNKLLVPNNAHVSGDKKQIEEQVQRLATKLNSMTGTIMLSVHKPESLARSANATVDAALQLASTARGLKDGDNAVQSKKIEDSTQEMCFTTYNLLKVGESVSHDPNNALHRRRLLDACRALNDAINKLVRTSSTTSPDKWQTECNELSRTVQLHQAFLQPTHPTCALSYDESFEAIQQQSDVIHKLKDNKPMSPEEFGQSLAYVTSATCNSMEYATQCAYLLSISEQHKEVAKSGLVDVGRIQKITGTMQQICFRVMRSAFIEDAKAEEGNLSREVQELQQAITEASAKPLVGEVKDQLVEAGQKVTSSFNELQSVFNGINPKEVDLAPVTINMIDAVAEVNFVMEHPSVVPKSGTTPVETQRSGEVIQSSRDFASHLLALLKDVKEKKYKANDDDDTMTWVMFNDRRKCVLDTFEALINKIRENGKLSGVMVTLHADDIGEDVTPKKSYIQSQVDLANKWLQRPIPKSDVKVAGQKAAKEVIDIAEKMAKDLQGTEKEEISHLISETDQLLGECSKNYDSEKASLLMDKLKELRKALARLVVTRVVEDFIEEETPLEDLEILTDAERDETKRKLILERKIAELLAQLSKVTKTARFVADTGSANHAVSQELKTCSNQAELLAPMLVKAAQERVNSPNNQAAIDHYKSLLDEYAKAMSKVRDLCDMSVDPLDFVQTAGDTMQRMRDESTEDNCPVKAFKVSNAIDKLVNRVFDVGMHNARSDPELQTALSSARERLAQIRPAPDTRPSKMPDWKLTTAEILRTTGEVESVLGGEIIFKKQPEPDQPIYNAALDLHAAIREWSARDNEIVAVAKRMAVLMAKLSEYMNNNKKREVIFTSKSIVEESHEVAHLAKKLALECTDIRIRTNLLQVCERIPTISGQLKMLTTVKSSFLGHQGTEEDKEAMNTLIGNAQNLMMSVQEVVKAAASASVKINAQRGGPRMRWVRRNIFY